MLVREVMMEHQKNQVTVGVLSTSNMAWRQEIASDGRKINSCWLDETTCCIREVGCKCFQKHCLECTNLCTNWVDSENCANLEEQFYEKSTDSEDI